MRISRLIEILKCEEEDHGDVEVETVNRDLSKFSEPINKVFCPAGTLYLSSEE
jgi:hypothetical protein